MFDRLVTDYSLFFRANRHHAAAGRELTAAGAECRLPKHDARPRSDPARDGLLSRHRPDQVLWYRFGIAAWEKRAK